MITNYLHIDDELLAVPPLGTECEPYEQVVRDTCNYGDSELDFLKMVVALAGECGELANKVKKTKDMSFVKRAVLLDEVSDLVYYAVALTHKLGFDFDEVLAWNAFKVTERKRLGKTYNLPQNG